MKKSWMTISAWLFIIIGALTIIRFMFCAPFNDGSGEHNATLFGQYGDFIGGFVGTLFSLAGFFMLYLTLKSQLFAIQKQDWDARMVSFETTFFNLLNSQQNITNDIKAQFTGLSGTNEIKTFTIQGRDFFRFAVIERNRINRGLQAATYEGFYDDKDNEYINYIISGLYEQSYSDPSFNPEDCEEEIVQQRRRQLLNKVYGITREQWESAQSLQDAERVKFIYEIFFKRYHYAIGHYFRNLYHILKFIDQFEYAQKNKTTEVDEKAEIRYKCFQYAQFVQAQMSAFELALLHDNALYFENMFHLVKKYNILENCSKDYLINKVDYISPTQHL